MRGEAGEMHPPSRELDEEQDVERLERHRLDGEEVAREDPPGLARRGTRSTWDRTGEVPVRGRAAAARSGWCSLRPERRD
jgi:hypothetical protein